MAQEIIDIIVREDGSRVVRRNLDDVGASAVSAQGQVDLLKKALYALGGALIAETVLRWSDAWIVATNQIRIATKTTAEAAQVQKELFEATQRSRTAILDTTQLYFRVQRASKDLGASQSQLISITESVGKALAIQGISGQQAGGALLQFGQALASPRIQSEEFNSLLDGMPVLLQAVANNFEGTGGSLGRFTQMVKKGLVSNTEFYAALMKGLPEIEAQFKTMTPTFAQSFQVLENGMTKAVGELTIGLGISTAFAKSMDFLSQHADILVGVLTTLGVAVAVAFAPRVVTMFAGALSSLFAMVTAHPIGMLVTALAAASVMLVQFGDNVNIGLDDITTFNDLLRATGSYATEGMAAMNEAVYSAMETFGSVLLDGIEAGDQILTDGTARWGQTYSEFYAGVGTGFAGLMKGVARTVDVILATVWAGFRGFGVWLYNLPNMLVEGMKRAYNLTIDIVEDLLNTVINSMNKMAASVGSPLLALVDIKRMEIDTKAFQNVGLEVDRAFGEGLQEGMGNIEGILDSIFVRAQTIAKERTDKLKGAVDLSKTVPPLLSNADDDTKKAEKLANALRTLLNTIDPIAGAKLELAKATETLSAAEKAGLISKTQEIEYLKRLKLHYQDILDPLGAMNRELSFEIGLLGYSAKVRQVEEELHRRTLQLRKDGVYITEAETQALRNQLTLKNEAILATQREDQLLQQSVERRKEMAAQIQSISGLLANPDSGFTGTDATSALSGMLPDLFAGTQEMYDAEKAKIAEYYGAIAQMREQNLISEQTASQMKMKLAVMETEQRMQQVSGMFGNLAVLSKSGNRKLAAIGKAAAISQATIDGVLAVQKALASAPPPLNYAMAAAVGVSTAANIAQISGVAFAKGGAFTNTVVNTPTPFSFGGGQLGVMGEAGPEAIMPLTRGSDGSLGVRAIGNHGGGVVQYVNFQISISGGDVAVSSEGEASRNTEELRDAVTAVCNEWALREMRPDGVLGKAMPNGAF